MNYHKLTCTKSVDVYLRIIDLFSELRACAHDLGLRLMKILYFIVKEVLLGFLINSRRQTNKRKGVVASLFTLPWRRLY